MGKPKDKPKPVKKAAGKILEALWDGKRR